MMTKADFERIEKELGVTLPEAYKQFQLKYPKPLHTHQESSWKGDPKDMYWLFFRADHVILYTKSNRESMGVYNAASGDVGKWPDQYLVIGREGTDGGDFFCLDLSRDDDVVWKFDHEESGFRRHAKSVRDYAAWLQKRI